MPVTRVGASNVIDSGVAIFDPNAPEVLIAFGYAGLMFSITLRLVDDQTGLMQTRVLGGPSPGLSVVDILNTGNSTGGGPTAQVAVFAVGSQTIDLNYRVFKADANLSKHLIYEILVR